MERRGWAILGLLAAVLLFQLLARPAVEVDETRYLSVAWEMRLSGDWFHLTRNFESYAHKPPLLFWLINLFWLVFGLSDLAGRLVGPVCALGVVALTGVLARRMYPTDEGLAVRAMAVLAGTSFFVLYAGATLFDALLTLPVLLGITLVWAMGNGARGLRVWLGFGAVLALGVYAKGPVILVHVMPALLLMRLWAPQPLTLRETALGVAGALAVAVALVALWLVPALVTGDAAFRHEILWEQTADRVTGTMAHARPIWFLVALLPLLLFPFGWSWRLWRRMPGVAWADPAARLCTVWAVSAVVLFSVIGSKQAHYLLPELAAFAILAARAIGGAGWRGGSVAALLPVAVGVGLLALAAGLIPVEGEAALLEPSWAVALVGLALLGLAGVALRGPVVAGHAVAGAGFAVALHALVGATGLGPSYETAPIAERLAQAQPGGVALVGMKYSAEFNFPARLTSPVATPQTEADLATWLAAHPQGLVFGPVDRAGISAEPVETILYAGRLFGFWPAAAVTVRG